MTFRSRKDQKAYDKFREEHKSAGCVFCKFSSNHEQVIGQSESFWISRNIFPYTVWEGLTVQDHLMILPKKHKNSMKEFTPKELKEFAELIAKYDTKGYSSYTRSHKNVSKSIVHQHTHLLKLGDEVAKISFYLSKPYFLWYKQ